MALLWVIPLQLFSRLTDLLDHEVFRLPLNDALDGGVSCPGMTTNQNRCSTTRLYSRAEIGASRRRKRRSTHSETAAVLRRGVSRPFVDPLVDLTEDLFVSCSGVRTPSSDDRTPTR